MIHPKDLEKELEDIISGRKQIAKYTPEGIIQYLTDNPIKDEKLAEVCSKAANDYYKEQE